MAGSLLERVEEKMKTPERNDPCSCGSGKKFKKCCEPKMVRGRFLATPVTAGVSAQIDKMMGLRSLFQTSLQGVSTRATPPVEEDLNQSGLEKKEDL
jgi:hypothetical protein